MGRKNKLKQVKRSSHTQQPSGGPMAEWFTNHISRRSVGKGLAWTAALTAAGVTVYQLSSDDDGREDSRDSLALQQKEGWNIGSTDRLLAFDGSSATDSRGKTWSGYDPNELIRVYTPRDPQWQPFFVSTLIQSLSQTSLSSQMRPVFTRQMADTYQRAEALRNLISQSPTANQTLIISELPGPQSIAVGAAMADTVSLVPIFDNWPHPLGVVRSHETIGAMVYYAHEIEEKRAKLPENAPAMLLLDSNRLTPPANEDTQFDNRYLAKLPSADQLKQRNIRQVIYLVRDQNQLAKDQSQELEMDDINEDFVEWQKNGINMRLLRLSEFKPYDEPAPATVAGTTTNEVHRSYHYGGSPLMAWWFFSHYGYGYPRDVGGPRGGRNIPIPPPASRPTFDPPNYRPTSRPTIFNASKIGGASQSGVGKTKPTGFGRTSVRVSNDGRVTGTRPGRSGSYGRSGGGWFGG
jgi:hypothetical protein